MAAPVFRRDSGSIFRRFLVFVLACFWLGGIVSGIALAQNGKPVIFPLMCRTWFSPVSIVCFFGVLLLPFLFSAFAVFISEPWLLFLVALVKGYSFSYVSFGMLLTHPCDGWLLRQLFMFSDLLCLPFLFWYWQNSLSWQRGFPLRRTLWALFVPVLIGSLDVCFVTPFLAVLIN